MVDRMSSQDKVRQNSSAKDEVSRYLSLESTQFERDQEVDRILRCFPMDPYAILQLPYNAEEPLIADIKANFRKKSLLVHPDKCRHPRAKDAFELLKKAQSALDDPKKRKQLIDMIEESMYYTKKQGLKPSDRDWESIVAKELKEVLIQDELRRRKQLRKEAELEGEIKRKEERERELSKGKREREKEWVEGREHRVQSWRSFQQVASQKSTAAKKRLAPDDRNGTKKMKVYAVRLPGGSS